MGDISKGVADTLQPAKKIYKKRVRSTYKLMNLSLPFFSIAKVWQYKNHRSIKEINGTSTYLAR